MTLNFAVGALAVDARHASLDYLLKRVTLSLNCESNRRLSRHGLTAPQCTALLQLQIEQQATVSELARVLSIDVSAMTRLLDRLEHKNLIARVRTPSDRRVVHVELTDKGRALTVDTSAAIVDTLSAHLAGFTLEEHQALRFSLVRMLVNAEEMQARCCQDPESSAVPTLSRVVKAG